MGRKYIPVTTGDSQYKVFLKDVKIIHKMAKKKRPPLPKYDREISLSPVYDNIEVEVEF